MTPKLQSEGLDELLVHAGWARALARRLVRDAHAADDLVQRTWVAALEHPPRGGAPRAWIESVLRNFALQDLRSRLRRKRREEHGARPERLEDGAGESLAAQEQLFVALKALDEPYRTLIWARYYEGLSASEIAARTETPLQTVKNRLTRAHELLRERLDRQHGGERARWCLAFLPWTADRGVAAALLGALLVNLKLKIGLVAAAAAGVALLWVSLAQRADQVPAPTPESALERPLLAAAEQDDGLVLTPTPELRSEAATAATDAPRAKPEASAVALVTLRGRVIDLECGPVGGIEVGASGPTDGAIGARLVRTAGDGTFEFVNLEQNASIGVRDPAWITVFKSSRVDEGESTTLVVSPRRALAGFVQDEGANALADAEVVLVLDEARRARLLARDEVLLEALWRTTTDAHGRFELPDAPLGLDRLLIMAGGFDPATFTPPQVPSFDLVYTLERVSADSLLVQGRVVDARGNPLAQSYVGLGGECARSAADGTFTLDLHPRTGRLERIRKHAAEAALVLTALGPGLQPARIPIGTFEELVQRASVERFELVLDTPTLEIRGRVVDDDDRPVAGAHVRVSDPTRFGRVPVDMGGMEVQFEQTVESIARNAQMMDPPAQTDTRGEFVLTGLCARSYQLEVIDVVNWRVAAHGPVVSGAHDVIIRLGDRRERIRVAGRVLSVAGEPVAQAIVRLALAVPGTYLKIDGRHAQTGADGSFEFDDVPRAALDLDVDGAHVLMYETERLDPDTDLSQLVVTVQLEGSFVVDLTRTPERADAIRVLDADDRPLELYALRGTLDPQSKSALMMYSNAEMPLQGGLSSKLDTGTHARTLVLLKQGQEVERVPLRLVVGELTTIEL